jgi:hypothetical protein
LLLIFLIIVCNSVRSGVEYVKLVRSGLGKGEVVLEGEGGD